jgi:subtilisin family serine protease
MRPPWARALRSAAVVAGIVVCTLTACGGALAATPKPGPVTTGEPGGRIIVRYRASTTAQAARAAAAAAGDRVVGRVRTFGLGHAGAVLVVASRTLSTGQLVRRYSADPDVAYAEPDSILTIDSTTPGDPYFGDLWGMSTIGAPTAWDTATGSPGVVVASIDTGVDYTHPDLAANMWHNPGEIPGNGLDDDGNGYADDVYGIDAAFDTADPWDPNGHGTHTAGTMAAVGNNGVGVTGVCWSAQIMALEYLDSDGSGYTSDALDCFYYMIAEKLYHGVDVVAANCSWGGGSYNQSLHDAIAAAGEAGIVVVCSAGNDGDDNDWSPAYPASYDCANIIAVAATDSSDGLADFSNYGASSVDLAAPGVGILSTVPDGGYDWMDGTSMAAPHVTGVVALVAAARPADDAATRIASILAGADAVSGLSGLVATGGRLDVSAAVGAPAPAADTVGPACAARSARVRHGRVVKLYFRVYDELSAQVTTDLRVTKRSGRTVMHRAWGYDRNYAGWWWVKYRCRLRPGTYRIVVRGTDLAGNVASVVGRARLRVL